MAAPCPINRRPMLKAEFVQIWRHLKEVELPEVPTFLAFVLNYNGSTLAPLHSTARGFHSVASPVWSVLHPVGLELLLDRGALDPGHQVVQQAFYTGHCYADLAQLEWEFKAGRLEAIQVPLPTPNGTSSLRLESLQTLLFPFSSHSRVPSPTNKKLSDINPSGRFTFGHGVFGDLRIFDIQFKGECVAYVVSVQECLTVYGADSPKTVTIWHLDSSYGLGQNS